MRELHQSIKELRLIAWILGTLGLILVAIPPVIWLWFMRQSSAMGGVSQNDAQRVTDNCVGAFKFGVLCIVISAFAKAGSAALIWMQSTISANSPRPPAADKIRR